MKRFRFSLWYNDVSLAKKLYFVMSVIGIFITIGLVALVVSLGSLSGIRGYVNGEDLWLKAQKDGVYNLSRYAIVRNEKDYIAFLQNMQVPLGDKKARLELEKENPDYNIARQGFREGGNHPDDVNSMIELFRRYRNFTYLDQAISIWANGDNEISKLMAVGEKLHREINSASPSEENMSILLSQIAPINEKLAVLENRFSETMGQGGRWLEDFVLKTLISILVIVAVTGLFFTVSLNKRIANSINDMILVAKKVAAGNFTARAVTSSKDELGIMSLSINRMIANLERQFNEINAVQEKLRTKTKQLDHAQQSAHIGSWEWDVPSNSIEWTDELYRILGYEPNEFEPTYNDYLDHIHADDRPKLNDLVMGAFNAGISANIELYHRVSRKDGTERILSGKVNLYGENGVILKMAGTIQDVTETKKSEKALIYKAQQLAEAQELGHFGSWEWNLETGKVEWSDELCRMHGLVPGEQEMTYDLAISFIHPEDRGFLEIPGSRQYEDQHQTNFFYRIIRPDGVVRIINGKGRVFTDSTGKTIRMRGTMQDVTELKKAEAELICKTNQLNKAQRSARIGSWEWNAKNDVLEWSEEMYRIYGLTENESVITYEILTKFIHPNDVEYVRNITKKQEQDKHRYNIYYRIIRPNGLELIVNARTEVFTDAKDKTIGASGTIQDVTKEKQIENKLLEFKYFFNTTSDLACISNTEGTFEIVNQSFVDKLGYTKKELTGRAFLSFIHPDDVKATIDELEGLKNGNPYVNFVNRYRTKSGKYLWFDWNVTPNPETGKHYRMARDITLQKENEQELIRLKELAETSEKVKDQFLANMSHEIRTPMNAIMGFSDLLTRSSLQEQEKDYVNTIKQAGENLLVIINDILDISKIQAGMMVIEKSDFSIRDSFKSIKALMAVKADPKNIALNFSCAPDVPETVAGDPARFTQIMINLVGNAVKFTPKGKIDVSAEVIENEKHDLRKDQVLIKFCVRDTGIGISADKLGNIFARFRQADRTTSRNYGGTGLGLSIAKQLVEMQGGKITAESTDKISAAQAETGSVFCFTIPYGKTAPAGVKKSDKKKYDFTMLQDINILIVEDNLLNVKLLQQLFKEFKLKSDVAENGRICIQKMEQTAYDIILMDMEMPVLNGYEATEIIRNKMKNKIPIVAMTANAMAGEREKCLSLGMNDYISKPLNGQLLFEIIFDITYNS